MSESWSLEVHTLRWLNIFLYSVYAISHQCSYFLVLLSVLGENKNISDNQVSQVRKMLLTVDSDQQ